MPVQFYLTAVNFVSMHVIVVNILRGIVCLPKLKVYLLTYLLTIIADRKPEFHIDASDIRCRSTFLCVGDPWQHGISVWDRTSI